METETAEQSGPDESPSSAMEGRWPRSPPAPPLGGPRGSDVWFYCTTAHRRWINLTASVPSYDLLDRYQRI